MPFSVKRLLDRPIIHQGMSPSLGNNINGPSLIRVPDWVRDPLGRYYLYFAHHEGRSIRLAYADHLTGPWHIHEPGALPIAQSLFPADPDLITPRPSDPSDVASVGVTDYVPHIASPDVLVDQGSQQILMYFHGMMEDGDQKTRLAVSADGLTFIPNPEVFDHYYFRVFDHAGYVYALSWGGYLYRSADRNGPFERGPATFETAPIGLPGRFLRHLALLKEGDRLHLFFSRIGDTPEVILHAEVTLDPDWTKWHVNEPEEILRPVDAWEGAELPITRSEAGVSFTPEHALRDPCIFRDEDGRTYLLYCGAAEQAIGIVEL